MIGVSIGVVIFIIGIPFGIWRYRNWTPERGEAASGGVGPEFMKTRAGYAGSAFLFSLGGVMMAAIFLFS